MTKLSALEKNLLADVKAAAGRKNSAAARNRMAAAIAQVAAMKYDASGWSEPGVLLHKVFSELAQACEDASCDDALRALAPDLLDGVGRLPTILGLPHEFRPLQQLKAAGLAPLLSCFDRALGRFDRAAVEGLGQGNPRGLAGFSVAEEALLRLLDYAGDEKLGARAVAGFAALPWTDERLWVVARMVAGGDGGGLSERQLARPSTGALLVPLLALAQGEGQQKLAASLVRAGHLARKKAPGSVPALPRALPADLDEAVALARSWGLTQRDIAAGKPATDRQIASLAAGLEVKLPADLVRLLKIHGTLTDRHLGPPARMKELIADLKGTLREHLSEEDSPVPYGRAGRYDIRIFPVEKSIPIGTDNNGDLFFLATAARSSAGLPPVVRFHHDATLECSIEADSIGQYFCQLLGAAYARREGLLRDLGKLLSRRRKLVRPAGQPPEWKRRK